MEKDMGYYANSLEVDFVIPPDKVAAALAAVNADFEPDGGYKTLTEAVEDTTSFIENTEKPETGFRLGYHVDKYVEANDELLQTLAPFAQDGSYARFLGESDELFGFRVVDGQLYNERCEMKWSVVE